MFCLLFVFKVQAIFPQKIVSLFLRNNSRKLIAYDNFTNITQRYDFKHFFCLSVSLNTFFSPLSSSLLSPFSFPLPLPLLAHLSPPPSLLLFSKFTMAHGKESCDLHLCTARSSPGINLSSTKAYGIFP